MVRHMIEEKLTVGLVVERRMLTGPWGGVAWRPVAVFPTPPDVAPWTPLGGSGEVMRYYAGEAHVHLYSTDTTNYRDNLESGAPKLWVVLRPDGDAPPIDVVAVTADPAEGEASTEAGENVVETIDMPGEIAATVADFIAAHHVERPIIKRKRDRAEPDVKWRVGAPGSGPPRKAE
jgi:Protein of unknown function (DUF3305)